MKFTDAVKSTFPILIISVLTLGLAPTSAFAVTTATANMAVTATVAASCSVSTTPMAFGTYSSLAISTSTATLSVTCTNTTPYTLGLNAGLGSGATVAARSMTGGAVLLGYGLYTDAGHTSNFATLASVNGTGSVQTTTIYGLIPAAQYVTPGAYADTIVATVTY